ncbi:FKBP-type peptidyl-prolyl cis-trans isomerase [Psychromonas antarctica]|uniref:FKBP-type peptidyl-prolyl cis-trans isomerase n=1 Tax=Psychromonas antarctica TaxID=67573 RepID=UPI001EE8133F|nr:FKBP-type peptidyl-prolyl cis-trans isomerase [Psychromonas antarctica]MCG6201121.1 FKBP-type peptidyl-prolyl cis-trans isomerase [Psychromonas antarctica]
MSKIIIVALILVALFFVFQRFSSSKNAPQNIQIGVEFLADNGQQEGVESTASGLQYVILTKGEGTVHPTAKSNVKVHYHGTLIDGTVFDSSVDRGEPISFGLNQVIAGWTEGVQLMVVGDKFRFYIPSNLAYGNRAAGKIPAGSLLIFDVELIAIN